MKVYGPYDNGEGRQLIIIIYDDGTRKTKSYPKYLVEQHLGRELDPELETIDHIDGDFLNNDLSNLRIIDRSAHSKQDKIRVKKIEVKCLWCGAKALKNANDANYNKNRGKAGPFCGRSCAGKYGKAIQMGTIDRFGNNYQDNREYYKLKDDMDIKGLE